MDGNQLIKNLLTERKLKNSAYSISALARDLKLTQPEVTRILGGKRDLTAKQAYKVASSLKYDEAMTLRLIVSTFAENQPLNL